MNSTNQPYPASARSGTVCRLEHYLQETPQNTVSHGHLTSTDRAHRRSRGRASTTQLRRNRRAVWEGGPLGRRTKHAVVGQLKRYLIVALLVPALASKPSMNGLASRPASSDPLQY